MSGSEVLNYTHPNVYNIKKLGRKEVVSKARFQRFVSVLYGILEEQEARLFPLVTVPLPGWQGSLTASAM